MGTPRHPSLYQINTRVWLTALAQSLGRPATLDDITDAELDGLAGMGFDWIWFLSVWQTRPGGTARLARQPGVAARIPGHARTTSGCTTSSATGMSGRSASTSTQATITRTRWPAFWKTTTSRAPNQGQCYVALPFGDLAGAEWRLADQIEGPSTTATSATFRIAGCTWTRHRGRRPCLPSSGGLQKPEV